MNIKEILYDSNRAYVTMVFEENEEKLPGSFLMKLLGNFKRIVDLSMEHHVLYFAVEVQPDEKNQFVNTLQKLVNTPMVTARQSVTKPITLPSRKPSENSEHLILDANVVKNSNDTNSLQGFPEKLTYNDQIIEWFKKVNEAKMPKNEKTPYYAKLKEAIRNKMGTKPNIGMMVAFREIYATLYSNWMKKDGVAPSLDREYVFNYFKTMPDAKLVACYQKIITNLEE